jgi:hypothetical protein
MRFVNLPARDAERPIALCAKRLEGRGEALPDG